MRKTRLYQSIFNLAQIPIAVGLGAVSLESTVRLNVRVPYQSNFNVQRAIPAPPPSNLVFSESPQLTQAPSKNAQAQFSGEAPQPTTIATTTVASNDGDPVNVRKVLYQTEFIAPQPPPTPTPTNLPVSLDADTISNVLLIYQANFNTLQPIVSIATTPTSWPWSWSPEQFKLPSKDHQFSAYEPRQFVAPPQPFTPSPERFRPPTKDHQFSAYDPQAFAPATPSFIGWQFWQPERFQLPSKDHQFSAISHRPFVLPPQAFAVSPEQYRIAVKDHQFSAYEPQTVPPATPAFIGWQFWQPELFKLSAKDHQFSAYEPQTFITATPSFIGWEFWQPEKFRLATKDHQFSGWAPALPIAATPTLWPWSYWPEKFRLSAKDHQFSAYDPRSLAAATVTPSALGFTVDEGVAGIRVIVLQDTMFLAIPTQATWGWASQWPDRFSAPYNVSLQQFGTLTLAPPPAVAQTPLASSFESIVISNYKLIYQSNFQTLRPIVAATVTPSSLAFTVDEGIAGVDVLVLYDTSFFSTSTSATQGWASQWPERFASPYNVSLQQFGSLTLQPPPTVIPASMAVSLESLVINNVRLIYQSNFYSPRIIPPASLTPANLGFSLSPERFAVPYNVSLQQFGALSPRTIPVPAVTPAGLGFSQDDGAACLRILVVYGTSFFAPPTPQTLSFTAQDPDLFSKPFNVSLQQFTGWPAETVPVAPVAGLAATSLESTVQLNVRIPYQSSFFLPQQQAFAVTPTALPWSYWPEKFQLPTKDHQFSGWAPTLPIAATTKTWPWSWSPEQFARPFNVALQQFQEFAPLGIVTFPTPVGWPPLEGPTVFNVTLLYQSAFNVQRPVTAPNPKTWPWSPSPEQFAKPFPVSLQRFQDFAPAGIIIALNPKIWPWTYSPERFAKPVNVSLQQFTGQPRQPGPAQTQQFIGWNFQDPERFTKTFPVALQQFQGWEPFVPPPPPPPPPPGFRFQQGSGQGGAGYGSRTADYRGGRLRISPALTRKDIELLLLQLPPEQRQPFLNELEDDELVWMLQNMFNDEE